MRFPLVRGRRSAPSVAALALVAPLLTVGGVLSGGAGATPVEQCSDLAGMTIADDAIGLPTGGAATFSAVPVGAGGTGAQAYGPHCLVSGHIEPVDPTAPDINFQLALPEEWNGKAVMLGGAGLNEFIPPLTNASNLWGAQKAPLPLSRGYAVFSSDSGHQPRQGEPPAAFGADAEALRNYAGDALKKTRDVAVTLISSRYGRAPAKSYFIGYSKGGGEALAAAQRWPADWDGVVAGAPGWNVTAVALNMLRTAQVVATPGAWLDEAERHTLHTGVAGVCDTLDGADDGIISNVRACGAEFDPSRLRCPDGEDSANTCLSDVQLAALQRLNRPEPLSYVIGAGETSLPGLPIYLADHGGGVPGSEHEALLTQLGIYGSTPPAFPPTPRMSLNLSLADGVIRHMIVGDPHFNTLAMDIPSGHGMAPHIEAHSALFSNITDLSAFRDRGGKLLMWTGTADPAVRTSAHYYTRMQADMGAAEVDSFVRYYEIPGAQHGPSSVFQPEWDQLAAIEGWVEDRVDPADDLIATDDSGVRGRTRPMCSFPTWPRYDGSGDINDAASFTCASR
ncbi:tannase/feruloyl esterase family alpha/beta hydrolase [Kineococcus sp. NUM-3379]